MIHLGDGQDIFLLMLSLSLSSQSAVCLFASLALSLALCRRVPFHLLYGIHFSRSLVQEKVAALLNEETGPVAGTNYCMVVAQHLGE